MKWVGSLRRKPWIIVVLICKKTTISICKKTIYGRFCIVLYSYCLEMIVNMYDNITITEKKLYKMTTVIL